MHKLTIFANFKIDSEERFLRMKDSFCSFCDSDIDKWVINVRGRYAKDVVSYLSGKLKSKLTAFQNESGKGWFYDSKNLLKYISTEYVMVWIEDQICMCGVDSLNRIIKDMSSKKVAYLGYTWFGLGTFIKEFNNINKQNAGTIWFVDYSRDINQQRQKNSLDLIGRKSCIISMPAIFSFGLFTELLNCRRPYLRRWPKETPFDFEKKWNDEYLLPVRYGIPKFEIFATIDDDNAVKGSSLISRSLYPRRISREKLLELRDGEKKSLNCIMKIMKKNIYITKIYMILKRISYHFI